MLRAQCVKDVFADYLHNFVDKYNTLTLTVLRLNTKYNSMVRSMMKENEKINKQIHWMGNETKLSAIKG